MKVVVNICRQCGKEFAKTNNRQLYCSKSCISKSRYPYWILWTQRNYRKQILHQIRCRSKRDNLEFNLSEKDIIIPEICPVLGILIKRNIGSGFHNDSPSVDRLDNNKGYTKDNIQVISNRANLLKGDATVEELEKVIQYMKDYNARCD